MDETEDQIPQVSDNALRVILQKLDSMAATIKDTQMRVQNLEEDEETVALQAVPLTNPIQVGETADRPWIMHPERKASEEQRFEDYSRVAPERYITADKSSGQSRGGRKSKLDGKVNIGGSRKTPKPGPRGYQNDRSNSTSTNQDESESARPIASETDERAHRNSPKNQQHPKQP